MAVAGVGVLLAALILKQFVLGAPQNIVSPPLVVHRATKRQAPPKVDAGLPAALRQALLAYPTVVAVLFRPGMPGDSDAVAAARQGAGTAHAGFAALDVSNESNARVAALKLTSESDPSVVVVRRPGTVSLVLPGYTDAQVVAQAAAESPGS